MKLFVLFCAIAQISWTKSSSISTELLIQQINSKKTTWTAGTNYPETTPAEFMAKRGEFFDFPLDPDDHVEVKTYRIRRATIPASFDARDQWPACRDIIGKIRDQGQCGGGWAFAATEVMSDRLCIQTGGELKVRFSPQEVISCCTICGYGCGGGVPLLVWNYWLQNGIVSGGDYNSNEGCQPFDQLSYLNNTTPACQQSCQNTNYKVSYSQDKRFGDYRYQIAADVQQIQTEIMTKGPVQAAMRLFEDFTVYKEGVYQHVTGKDTAGHAIKIIGWGTENGVPYWLVANSWGTHWGNLGGYFKIRRGYNESAIEDKIIAGRAYVQAGAYDPPPGGSAIQVVSSSFGLLLVGVIFFGVMK